MTLEEGETRYARMWPHSTNPDRGRILCVQTQVIHLCTRPRTLIRGYLQGT